MSATFKQDMPPAGGYSPINYQRIPAKANWNSMLRFGIAVGISIVGWIGYHHTKRQYVNEKIETRCARLALMPMLMAEEDRMQLKQLKRNVKLEAEIMKDVPGWEVGKWKNLPVYLSIGPNDYFKPNMFEYYAHAPEKEMNEAFNIMKTT